MGSFSKNYEAISLATGTTNSSTLGNGITANTVHQIYCLSTGVITINPMGGGSFIWSGTTNSFIDVVPSSVVVDSGSTGCFIGFRVKNMGNSYTQNAF